MVKYKGSETYRDGAKLPIKARDMGRLLRTARRRGTTPYDSRNLRNPRLTRDHFELEGFEELSEAKKKRITKLHNKNYPKGTHYCATHVEHAEWGEGRTITSQHAAPDQYGDIDWYDVMFEHGIEQGVSTDDLQILVAEVHENHDHHDGDQLDEAPTKSHLKALVKKGRMAAMQAKSTSDERRERETGDDPERNMKTFWDCRKNRKTAPRYPILSCT